MNQEFKTESVIGLEVHIELDTNTKLFCSCQTKGNEDPNTRCCPVCLGHPGAKPVLNKKALEYGLLICNALKCKIRNELVFSRKSYFYPDLSKNYQITQYEEPLGQEGKLILSSGKEIRIKRAHLEEDPAALIHPAGIHESKYVLIDYNRSGNPLIEIVTEPDLESPDEAREFLKELINILDYLEIFDKKKGIIKADANVSVKKTRYTRVEVKNITGFKELERAMQFEIQRQNNNPEDVAKETRSWDAETGKTRSMRKKEVEEEYGYITDPDLSPIDITKKMIIETHKKTPELPLERSERLTKQYLINPLDARVICQDKDLSILFERIAKQINPDLAAKWIRREVAGLMNSQDKTLSQIGLNEKHFTELLTLVKDKTITDATAKKMLTDLMEKDFSPSEYVKKHSLTAVHDEDQIHAWCREAIEENPAAVEDYKAGKEKAKQYFIGQVMKKSKGKANPEIVNKIIDEMIKKSG